MSETKTFYAQDAMMAYSRWLLAFKGNPDFGAFIDWLGFGSHIGNKYWDTVTISITAPVDSKPVKKMEMLLSPHWLAITKAWQAQARGRND